MTDMDEVKEKIASRYWASSANYRKLGGITDWLPVDFKRQELIDKTPFYEFADQILSLIQPLIEEARKEAAKWVDETFTDSVTKGEMLTTNAWQEYFENEH